MKKILFVGLLICATDLVAQHGQVDTLKYCLDEDLVGLGGFDPISYFKLNKPVEGNEDINAQFENVTYYFSSKSNKKLFLASPETYLPQFGGWCSMNLAMGQATTPTYSNFMVKNNKLYLFERTLSVDGREVWRQDPKQNEKLASANYNQYRHTGKIK